MALDRPLCSPRRADRAENSEATVISRAPSPCLSTRSPAEPRPSSKVLAAHDADRFAIRLATCRGAIDLEARGSQPSSVHSCKAPINQKPAATDAGRVGRRRRSRSPRKLEARDLETEGTPRGLLLTSQE